MLNLTIMDVWRNSPDKLDLNALTVEDYYKRLTSIALSLFEWEGLPETCNPRHLEETLFLHGQALFYNDNTLGYMHAKTTKSGQLNHYDEPQSYTAVSAVYSKEYDRDKCVLIRNNYLERPTDHTILLFALRLAEAERTIDVNVQAQKTPYFITCDEKDRLSIENIFKKIKDNMLMILGSKSFNVDNIKVLKTDAPQVFTELQEYKRQIWNEAMTFLGINNANTDKRERLITNEVDANNELIQINAEVMLLTRQQACEQINKMYGLNVSVKMRDFKENEVKKEVDE